jgi:L-fucose mutarotase
MGLLKGIDPLLTPDLLWVLRSMGHGDKICIVDVNFPACEVATKTTTKKHIILPVSLPQAVNAIASVLPLDYFVDHNTDYAAGIMSPSHGLTLPTEGEQVRDETQNVLNHHYNQTITSSLRSVERFEFYQAARSCFAVVQTMERRPYGNIILQKGVIGPDGKDLKP